MLIPANAEIKPTSLPLVARVKASIIMRSRP
jgi:hypothetical protein